MCRYARFPQARSHITTHSPLCAAIVLTHLPLTNGDFRRKYRPITGSHGPLVTTNNPLDHMILNAMDKIISTHRPLCVTIVLTHLTLPNSDFRRKYRPITGSRGPLMTTDNPLDHVILNAMDKCDQAWENWTYLHINWIPLFVCT